MRAFFCYDVEGEREREVFPQNLNLKLVFPPSVLNEQLGIVPAKSLMTFYAEKISGLEKDVAKVVCEHTLSRLQSRIVSFEEQVSLDFLHTSLASRQRRVRVCRPLPDVLILTVSFMLYTGHSDSTGFG